MKSKRSGDEKPKSLPAGSKVQQVKKLDDMPRFRKASNIFLGVAIAVAVFVFAFKYRNATIENQLLSEQNSLTNAANDLVGLKRTLVAPMGAETNYASMRNSYYQDGIRMADSAIDQAGTDNPLLTAAALVCKGNLNFTLADLPALMGATTQPSLQPQLPIKTLLDNAAEAFGRVISDYPHDIPQVTAARFGLASVSEDRAVDDSTQWDEARKHYQAIIDSGTSQVFKEMATQQMAMIATMAKPVITGLAGVPTSQPSTEPTAAMPLGPSLPDTMPTTMP